MARPKTGGRQKGSTNKTTIEFREAVNMLLTHATPKMIGWLDRIAEDDPYKALSIVDKFAEFASPKLARTELTGTISGTIAVQIVDDVK